MDGTAILISEKMKNEMSVNAPRIELTHHAIMWISTKGILEEHEEKVIDIIKEKLADKNLVFYGYCFGRFDLIIEFIEDSAKVASHYVCSLQEKIEKELSAALGKENVVCSSLTLACRVNPRGKDNSNKPVRTYTFLMPKSEGLDLNEITDFTCELNKDSSTKVELYWNSSSYSFILIGEGNVFTDVFNKILTFRKRMRNDFAESCTYVGLRWGETDESEEDIRAYTFVKLKDGFGELNLDKDSSIWQEQFKRLGWSDICLEAKGKTLKEIKSAILELRKNHDDILNTSTLLLSQKQEPENE